MIAFAELLERLVFTPSRNAKVALLRRYFETQPDPDRGIGLAAVTGELSFTAAKPGLIRELAAARTDPVLFAWSYDYVGDLAETVALMWPAAPTNAPPPRLPDVVEALESAPKTRLPEIVAAWLDASDPSVRLALLKLITGGLRVGASARMAKIALAEIGGVSADDVEEVWHGLAPPYLPLFAWLEKRAPRPTRPRPRSSARPCSPIRWKSPTSPHCSPTIGAPSGNGTAFACSSLRPRAAAGSTRAAPRTSPPHSPKSSRRWISRPCSTASCWSMRDGQVAPFADLQQRLNRKVVSARMMSDYPVGIRLYDMLFEATDDIRAAVLRRPPGPPGILVCPDASRADGSVRPDPVLLARRADGLA